MTNTNTNAIITSAQVSALVADLTNFAPKWYDTVGEMAGIKGSAVYRAVRKGIDLTGSNAAALLSLSTGAAAVTEEGTEFYGPIEGVSAEKTLEGINERFSVMADLVDMAIDNVLPAIMITGPGGIGKTYPVERALESAMTERNIPFVAVSGSISPVELYAAAHAVRNGGVLLLDDCDAALATQESMNILKALTCSKGTRIVSWMKQSKGPGSLEDRGIEAQYEFKGSVVVISNANVREIADGTSKKAGHMDAILSRAMHIDLGINDARSLALRVNHMIEDCDMLAHTLSKFGIYGDDYDALKVEIGAFIKENAEAFRSLTLREADKIAKCAGACIKSGKDWKRIARLTLGIL